MLTRILMGIILIVSLVGLMLLDLRFAPWYPLLYAICMTGSQLAVKELNQILCILEKPRRIALHILVGLIITSNWLPHLPCQSMFTNVDTARVVGGFFVASILALMTLELRSFQNDGTNSGRVLKAIFTIVYLGLLPSFLIQIRWITSHIHHLPSTGLLCLGATITCTKCADIGAYFTGRLIGKTPMAPLLSPKKTLEGLAGGLALSTVAACLWYRFLPETPFCCTSGAALFGFCVGGTGVMGDLFESMLKRDSGIKDASSLLPGFGGCLDVLDSLLVAGPIAWLFFS